MATRAKRSEGFDAALAELPPAVRWREWMGWVEAVIVASAKPVPHDVLQRVVGAGCNLDLIIDDIREELRGRPYELVPVASGWLHRTKPAFASAIRASGAVSQPRSELSKQDATVLIGIAYFQPITRGQLSQILGKAISRDTIGHLKRQGFIDAGPRSPEPGAVQKTLRADFEDCCLRGRENQQSNSVGIGLAFIVEPDWHSG